MFPSNPAYLNKGSSYGIFVDGRVAFPNPRSMRQPYTNRTSSLGNILEGGVKMHPAWIIAILGLSAVLFFKWDDRRMAARGIY